MVYYQDEPALSFWENVLKKFYRLLIHIFGSIIFLIFAVILGVFIVELLLFVAHSTSHADAFRYVLFFTARILYVFAAMLYVRVYRYAYRYLLNQSYREELHYRIFKYFWLSVFFYAVSLCIALLLFI